MYMYVCMHITHRLVVLTDQAETAPSTELPNNLTLEALQRAWQGECCTSKATWKCYKLMMRLYYKDTPRINFFPRNEPEEWFGPLGPFDSIVHLEMSDNIRCGIVAGRDI